MAWGNDIQYPELLDENVTLATTLGAAGYVSAAFINGDYFHRNARASSPGFTESHAPHELGRTVWKSDPYEEAAALSRYLAERATDPRPFLAWTHPDGASTEPPTGHWTTPREFGPTPVDHYDEEVARADDVSLLAHAGRGGRAGGARRPVVESPSSPTTARRSASTASTSTRRICTIEQVRVPLIVRGPGIAPGERSASWCRSWT